MASIFRQRYTVKGKDGKRVRKQSRYWYIDYKAAQGVRRRVKGFRDKTATAQLAAQLEREAERQEAGIADRYKEHRKRPLTEHLEDFRKSLGDTTKHARQTYNSLVRVFEICKFNKWDDVSASTFLNCLNTLRIKGDMSQRTFNFYLKAGKQFCRWMLQDQRASQSPLSHLKCETVTKRKRQRRALDTNELRKLLETTTTSETRYGMTGHERALLYRFASETGLRAKELRNLKVASFDFDNLMVTATDTKNKKTAVLPLRADTAGELRAFFTGKMPNAKAFGGTYKKLTDRTAEMLCSDLAETGIEYMDETGRYFDFHALRGECGTLLAASGVHPKVAQSIMRHSDINLTMNTYSHILRGQEAKAVESLPDLSLPDRTSQRATGTDDQIVDGAYKKLTKKSDFDRKSVASICTEKEKGLSDNKRNPQIGKPLQSAKLDTKKDRMSPSDIGQKMNGRYRIRTCDPLIKSQMIETVKPIKNNTLQIDKSSTVAPAYKEQPKMQGKSSPDLPDDLAEIEMVWPELPEHIKAAIKALIQAHKGEES